ncbi:hypothetical protein [Streptomyces buecherae]|uniref:hypothetical protein n=1 Tax=Streptomyces buecherae TaxID=2763006 RepID=UPI001E487B95|nr:hypothetical protein [Streptomyces buecherae]
MSPRTADPYGTERPGPSLRAPRRALGARAVALGVFGAVAALLVAGCGIRSTSVPVDAGAAPSRASCQLPGSAASPRATDGVAVTVQLVCSAQLLPVQRVLRLPKGDQAPRPDEFARALLNQLQQPESAAEATAGFSSEVGPWVRVSGPTKGDPAGTLRLNREPDELPPYALAQLVCTFAETPAVGGRRAVVLGGPAAPEGEDTLGVGGLKRYECGTDLRTRPQSAQSSGTLVE